MQVFKKIRRVFDRLPGITDSESNSALSRARYSDTNGGVPPDLHTHTWERVRAVALASVMVLSMLAIGGAAIAPSAASVPDGMVAIPDENVDSDIPACDGPGGPSGNPMCDAADAMEAAGVYASAGPSTLEVVFTNPGRAEQHYAGTSLQGGGPVAMVFIDEQVSDGREVAVSREVLADVLEHEPGVAYGTYENGSEWQTAIEYEGDYAVIDIPHFSTQSVTFSGSVSLFGDPAEHGDQFNYDLDSEEGLDNFDIAVTGTEHTKEESINDEFNDGGSEDYRVGGTTEAVGHDETANPELTLTGVVNTDEVSETGSHSTSGSWSGEIEGNIDPDDAQITIAADREYHFSDDGEQQIGDYATWDYDNWPDELDRIGIPTYEDASFEDEYDVLVDKGDGFEFVDTVLWKGNQHDEDFTWADADLDTSDADYVTVKLDPNDYEGTTREMESPRIDSPLPDTTVDYDGGSTSISGSGTENLDNIEAGSSLSFSFDHGSIGWNLEYKRTYQTEDPSIDATGDGSTNLFESGVISEGEEHSTSVSLTPDNYTLEVDTEGDSPVEVTLEWTEVTETVDPTIIINGEHETSYTGTLAEGTTESLTTDTAWIQEGENTVEVEMADANDGPTPQVGLEYSHDADAASKEVEYESETWHQRYNVSNTWASEQDDATVEFPMSSRVVSVDNLEVRTNGGMWETVAESDYTLDETDLTVQLGQIDPDTTKDVRVDATKVVTSGGEIQVTDPTTEGNEINTEVEITSVSGEYVEIDISGTERAHRVHYVTAASWDESDTYAEMGTDDNQTIHLVDGPTDGTATIEEAPFEIDPESGSTDVWIEDVDEPRITLESVSSDTDVTWTDAVSGNEYDLLLLPDEEVKDTATAGSPVTLTTDEDGTYIIETSDGDGGTSGVVSASPDTPRDGIFPNELWMVVILLLSVIGVSLIVSGLGEERQPRERTIPVLGRRISLPAFGGLSERQSLAIIAASFGVVALLLIDVTGPGSAVFEAIGAGLLAVTPVAEFGAIVLGAALLLGLWWLDNRTRQTIPRWLIGGTAALWLLWSIETMGEGTILEPLSAGFEAVAPLFWFALLGGGAWFAWRWMQTRGQPDTEVTLEVQE